MGFYDAIGAFLAAGDDLVDAVEPAFWAGIEHFHADGFRLGDPARYLHAPGHPHLLKPVFGPPACPGCLPPVHGEVALLRCGASGQVERLAVDSSAAEGESFRWVPLESGPDGKVVFGPLAAPQGPRRASSRKGSTIAKVEPA